MWLFRRLSLNVLRVLKFPSLLFTCVSFLHLCTGVSKKWVGHLTPVCLSNNAFSSVQFSSVTQSYPTFCDPMNCSMPGLPVHHQLPEFTQTHVHWVSDAIQPSHPLLSPSPPAFNLSQHQGFFKWVSSSHQVESFPTPQFKTISSSALSFLYTLTLTSLHAAAAAAAKSLQSCPTLCNPIDSSPPGSPVPGVLKARTLKRVAISFSNAWKWSRSVVADS